jgi:hypothetical protein
VDDDFTLHSTYKEEAGALHALGETVKSRIAIANTLDFLGVKS